MKKLLMAATLATALAGGAALAEGQTHRVAIHVDQNDAHTMNMALNNATNLAAYYKEQGDEVVIEMVAYGPGLNMLVEGKSPVAQRISSMSLEMDNITFAACANTLAAMERKAGGEVPLMDEAKIVPSGVVRLIELQEDGYAYVRP